MKIFFCKLDTFFIISASDNFSERNSRHGLVCQTHALKCFLCVFTVLFCFFMNNKHHNYEFWRTYAEGCGVPFKYWILREEYTFDLLGFMLRPFLPPEERDWRVNRVLSASSFANQGFKVRVPFVRPTALIFITSLKKNLSLAYNKPQPPWT
jgi:hypothetical protein